MCLDHIHGKTYHKRHGTIKNAFSYDVDYILTDFSARRLPKLFSYNSFNITALYDCDHGGERATGKGVAWVRNLLVQRGFHTLAEQRIELLAQPRLWGRVFNPVSFWLIYNQSAQLTLALAEVNNTFGQRHYYLCYKDDLSAIGKTDSLHARKVFHVSPFQDVAGAYEFRFAISKDSVSIWINYTNGDDGVLATYRGKRQTLSNTSILQAALKRPFGALRILGLIHWQAVKLKCKGALFRPKPQPPRKLVSR